MSWRPLDCSHWSCCRPTVTINTLYIIIVLIQIEALNHMTGVIKHEFRQTLPGHRSTWQGLVRPCQFCSRNYLPQLYTMTSYFMQIPIPVMWKPRRKYKRSCNNINGFYLCNKQGLHPKKARPSKTSSIAAYGYHEICDTTIQYLLVNQHTARGSNILIFWAKQRSFPCLLASLEHEHLPVRTFRACTQGPLL